VTADASDLLRQTLAGRYTIERELGRGGNAVVYLARDLRHDRRVAIKVIVSELAQSVRTERFLGEIQIAAKLTHPHILPLHDSGEAGGFLYYVMPYVKGESLRARLDRERQLPVDESLRITRDVAAALSHAHNQGVVHRDIKPENILLDESGEAMVADFGIARALTVATDSGVTESGVAVGTPEYMSPEQAAASATVDQRSDIYSLGCVLYEMLAGHPPFGGETPQEVMARHALDPVPSLKAARSGVPPGVERALAQALGKQPADRFATASRFIEALAAPETQRAPVSRRAAWTAALIVGALVGGGFWTSQRMSRTAAASVAVVPFANLSSDTAQSFFSRGMTEEITNQLAQVAGLRVVPVSEGYVAGRGTSAQEIGAELRVRKVLLGSVRREADALRISVRLINAEDGAQIWAETYPRRMRDVFAVQEEIARAIARALAVQFAVAGTASPFRRPTENLDAYDLYLRGRALYSRRTRGFLQQALAYYQAAIAKDSNYALAWAGVAQVYNLRYRFGDASLDETRSPAESAAARALVLDSTLAEAHTAMALVLHSYGWDFRRAESEFRRAIALNPRYPDAHASLGFMLAYTLGRFGEGVREARLAMELDPLSPQLHHNLSNTLRSARRYDEAIMEARTAITLEPSSPVGYQRLGTALLGKGLYREALEAFRTGINLQGTGSSFGLGATYAAMGERDRAREVLQRHERRDTGSTAVQIATIYARLGDLDRAFAWLERAYQYNSYYLRGLPGQTGDVFRSDPRFARLLKRMGLEP